MNPKNLVNLKEMIKDRDYDLKRINERYELSQTQDIKQYIVSVKIPRGNSHYQNLIRAFERAGAEKTEREYFLCNFREISIPSTQ